MKYNKLYPHRWEDGTYSIFINWGYQEDSILNNLPIIAELTGIAWYMIPDMLKQFNAINNKIHGWCFPDKEFAELCIVTLNMLRITKRE